MSDETYMIIRFHANEEKEVIQEGLTLEEAQEWCRSEETHGDDWFDGYGAE